MNSKDDLKAENLTETDDNDSKGNSIRSSIRIEKETVRQSLQKEIDSGVLQGFHMENCIIMVGGCYDNTVINSGEITDGITQYHNSVQQKKVNSPGSQMKNEVDLAEFIKDHADTTIFFALIALTALEMIPENMMYHIMDLLYNRFLKGINSGEAASDIWKEKMILSFDELLHTIGAKKVRAIQKSNTGNMPINCIVFEKQDEMQWMYEALWKNYPQYREIIVDWLFSLKEDELLKRLISFQIADGMSRFAKVDFNYANDYIIGRLAQNKRYDDLNYLVIILTALKACYSQNVDRLLCNWLNKDKILWLVGYRMYTRENNFSYLKLVERKIWNIIVDEMKIGIGQNSGIIDWFSASRNDIVFPAHFQKDLAELLIKSISQAFHQCVSYSEQNMAAFYFLILFREDCICAHWSSQELIFIRAFNFEIRKEISDLIRFIWVRKEFRDIMAEILQQYFEAFSGGKGKWEYMKAFFRTVAFTGNSFDYYITIDLLNNISLSSKKNNHIALELKQWLEQLLASRKIHQ